MDINKVRLVKRLVKSRYMEDQELKEKEIASIREDWIKFGFSIEDLEERMDVGE